MCVCVSVRTLTTEPFDLWPCICVCLSIHDKQKDFWAKGLYNGGTREVRERSGVFILAINSTFSHFPYHVLVCHMPYLRIATCLYAILWCQSNKNKGNEIVGEYTSQFSLDLVLEYKVFLMVVLEGIHSLLLKTAWCHTVGVEHLVKIWFMDFRKMVNLERGPSRTSELSEGYLYQNHQQKNFGLWDRVKSAYPLTKISFAQWHLTNIWTYLKMTHAKIVNVHRANCCQDVI